MDNSNRKVGREMQRRNHWSQPFPGRCPTTEFFRPAGPDELKALRLTGNFLESAKTPTEER